MKKALSLLLVLAMVLSMVPAVFAEETVAPEAISSLDGITVGKGETKTYTYTPAELTVLELETVGDAAVYVDDELILGDVIDIPVSTEDWNGDVDVDDNYGDANSYQFNADTSYTIKVVGQNTASELSVVKTTVTLLSQENTVSNSGTIYYQGYFSGMIMTVTGSDYTVSYNGETLTPVDGVVTTTVTSSNPRMPIEFSVTGDGEVQINFTYPVGHSQNPAELVLGDNSAVIEAGDTDGYYFTYTAQGDDVLKLTFSSDVTGWTYIVNNMTTYVYGDTQVSDSATVVNPVEIEVAAGDELQIMVNTYDPADSWNNPAGTVTVNAEIVAGSQSNAICLQNLENTVTNAGTMYYYGYFSGTVMTITGAESAVYNGETLTADENGVISTPVSSSNPRMPVEFSVTGDGEVQINFAYPVGNQSNPAVLQMGENVASIEAGNTQGYYYTWTATEDGTLSITMPSDMGWTYAINNMTTYVYGDTQWSDSDPVVNPGTVEVAAGDQLMIMVNTYDPANTWTAPAGKLIITAALEAACEHANTTTTNTATCTEAGVETVVCNDCGETVSSTDVDALGHDYTGENGACIRCGEYQVDESLVFYNKGILLSADIRGVLQVRKYKSTSPYESFKVIAEKGGVETELELATASDKTNYTTYSYAMTVPAKELADVTNLRIIGITGEGVYYTSINYTWSIKEGLISSMDSYSALGTEDGALRTKLCANILNYGAEAQKHFGYATDNLATDGLKEEYAALIITTTPDMEAIAKAEEPSGTYATLKEIGFNLAARVQILPRFTVPKADSKESYSAEITKVHVAPDGTETVTTFTLDGDKIIKGSSSTSLYVYIDNLASKELRDVMTITLMKDGEAVSVIHTFSGESALYSKLDSIPALAAALMNYCDCARAVFG